MPFDVQRNERVHCRELISENRRTGFIFINEQTIRATIYSYDDQFNVDVDRPVYLQTATAAIVSLYLNIRGNSAGAHGHGEAAIYSEEFISSLAVIGPDRWSDDDRLKLVNFTVEHAELMLCNREKTDDLSKLDRPSKRYAELFSVRVGQITMRAEYFTTDTLQFGRGRKIWPRLQIEFDHGVSLSDYFKHVLCVVTFLSFSLGRNLRPKTIQIGRLSIDEERLAAIEKRDFGGYHSVEYTWPVDVKERPESWANYPVLSARDEAQLAILMACLSSWAERFPAWRSANALMMNCLALEGEMTGIRLLAACTWFEEIPNSKSDVAIKPDDIEAIARSATEKAIELGYSKLEGRIKSSVTKVSGETRRSQFSRLIRSVKEKFGDEIVNDDIAKHLEAVMRFRGTAAHGHLNTDDDEKYRAFAKAVYAMEALCFLLTARDLPIEEAGIERMRQSPFLQNYHLSL
jgi:hypothetical protein